MKHLLIACVILLGACAPLEAPSSPTATVAPAIVKPKGKTPQSASTPAAAVKDDGVPSGVTPASITTNPNFIAPEILGRPTDTSVIVNVVPATAMDVYAEYSSTTGAYDRQSAAVSAPGGSPIEIVIDQLQANTRYYYRLRYGNSTGPEHTFITQRAPGSTFTFDIQGDSHPERVNKQFDADLYTRALLNAAADQPDFYLTSGDDFSVDQLKTVNADAVTQLYINQRRWLGLVDAPVFLVNGNHEQASLANLNGTPDNVAVWAQTARNVYYPQPAPDDFYTGDAQPVEFIGQLRDYYAYTWGDALFVIIDPYWHSAQTVDNQFGAERDQKAKRDLWNVTLGDAQYQWFKQTLETSTAQYKFVFTHHVLGTGRGGIENAGSYEWGDAAGLAAQRPGWDQTLQQLMVNNGVTIFFQGHDHIFARQELDGVIYQTLPEPANPFYTYENADAYRSGDKFPNSGHVRVTVSPEGVKVDYVRSFLPQDETGGHVNGEVAYSYTVPAKGPRTPPATNAPANKQGSAATQNLALDVPAQPIDVILGRPTQRSIVVSVLAYQDVEGFIEYGASNTYSNQTPPQAFSANQPVEVLIDALQADTPYTYRVKYRAGNAGETAATDAGTFHTQRAPGSAFTFALQADSHLDSNSDPQVYAQTLTNERADRPDFLIDLGDTFMTDKYQPYTAAQPQYLAQRSLFGTLAPSPLFLALGNHDGEDSSRGGTAKEMSAWSAQLRTQYFPNPVPDDFYTGNSTLDKTVGALQDYYTWEWGDALFIVLDPYRFTSSPSSGMTAIPWNRTLGDAQYQWLKQTLEASRATWKFVFIHQLVGGLDKDGRGGVEVAPYFEWGGHNADGSDGFATERPGWAMPIHQLLVANHVTAVFHGHDHLFVKQELDGIVYQEAPQPSAARSGSTNSAAEYGYVTGDILGSSGHLRVTVTSEQVTVAYVRAYLAKDEQPDQQNGQVGYTYTIK